MYSLRRRIFRTENRIFRIADHMRTAKARAVSRMSERQRAEFKATGVNPSKNSVVLASLETAASLLSDIQSEQRRLGFLKTVQVIEGGAKPWNAPTYAARGILKEVASA